MTYDQGELELMSVSHTHEHDKHLLGRLLDALTEELDIDIHGAGSMTFKRKDLKRGLEPDECYWIQNAALMQSRKDFDLERDPPPDLAVEVDVTSSSLDRMSIYADLGVPEVWRFDGEAFSVLVLGEGGSYEQAECSPALPGLLPNVVLRFLRLSDEMGETDLMLAFRDWVRQEGPRPARKQRRPRKK